MGETEQRLHLGASKDVGQNRQLNYARTPIKRTVSHITERTAKKGEAKRRLK